MNDIKVLKEINSHKGSDLNMGVGDQSTGGLSSLTRKAMTQV